MAILRALEIVSVTQNVEIITDSEYSINCVTVWHKSWERKNWQTSNRQPVMNQDIIKAVLAKIEERTVTRAATKFTWVKGHAADKGNIAADRLAVAGSNKPRRD
jgi:ribonuclease HI